ncbi:MAG: DotU family type IV/VI secretion system protein [Legionellales bacterium]|nr:DotU family type IV/VI secretion system protein [Legionellales bacterium]
MKEEQVLAADYDKDISTRSSTVSNALVLPKKNDVLVYSFCRSKTFIARSGVNPLVAAASALFSLISKLRHTEQYENSTNLRENLIYEVKAFECAALERHYQAEQIVLARYVICATLDETIVQTKWGRESDWHQYSLINAFDGDETTGERVFALLERLHNKTKDSIDLLEFFYLCLSLGFEGKYRLIDNGHQKLDRLLDDLFRTIRLERGDNLSSLVMMKGSRSAAPSKNLPKLPLKRILMVLGAILVVIYFSFIMMLHIEIKPVYQLLSTIVADTTNNDA